jgi:VWFA-related protein
MEARMMAQLSRVSTLILSTACLFFGQQAPPESSQAFHSETQLSAQTAGSGGNEAAGPVIRVDVNLRQVDVVVNDPQGRLVTDLRPDDFLVLEDGKPQKLTNFSWIEVAPPPTGAPLKALQERQSILEWFTGAPKSAKPPGNDILAAPVANPRKEEIRRTIAFVFQGASANPLAPVVARVRKFIDEQVGPGDMISIRSVQRSVIPLPRGRVMIRDSMGIFQQFTNDKRQLDAATERILRTCDALHSCVPDATGALRDAIQSLRDVPGRKAVVFVGTYLGPVESIANLANLAGVVVYVLNTKGLGGAADFPVEAIIARTATDLAKRTGGRRVLTDPGFDLTSDLNEVMQDLSGYYLLGYHTTLSDADFTRKMAAHNKPAGHNIEVKVLRAGFTAHFRDGFIGAPSPAAKPAAPPAGREDALTDAMFSIFTADGVRVHLDPMFVASPPDPKTGKRRPVVRALLDVDGRDMTFTELESGARRTVLDVALAVFNADGTQAGAKDQAFTLSVPRETLAKNPKMSFQYGVDIPVPAPGAYQVRTAVRDAASRKLGSSYAFLDIPDFNRREISLSSLALSPPPGAPAPPAIRPEWNEFAPGTPVQFRCEVFGLKTPGKPPASPKVDVGVRLYRGGTPVVDIPPAAAKIENQGSLSFLAGLVQIPSDLPAGNYEMELKAYDRLEAPRKQAAMQWTDLTIVRSETPE